MPVQESVLALQERLANEQKLVHVIDRIHSAKTLDSIFIEVQGEITAFLEAERMTLYAVDQDRKEIYSKYLALDSVREIRVSISDKSISGFVALTGKTINIADAYDKAELAKVSPTLSFDSSFDRRTGFRSTQILAIPILHESKTVVGVLQLLNKKHGPRFTREDEASAARIAKTLAIAFHNQNQLTQQRRGTKFDYLISQGLVNQDEVNAAITEARKHQTDVETILLEQYKVPKGELGTSLSQYYKIPYIEFSDRIVPPPDIMRDLKLDYLKRNLWMPLRREDNAVLVLVDNPQDLQKVDSISAALRHQNIKLAVGLRKDIEKFLALASGESMSKDSIGSILTDLGSEVTTAVDTDVTSGEVDENDSAVIRLANQIINDGYKARASDIHVEPYGPQKDMVIRFRIDGSCREYQKIPGAYRRALAARLKIMSMLDIAERRKPQDGKIKFRVADNREIELRVATVPTAGQQEDVVMRILAASEPIPVEKLGMTERNLREVRGAAEKPYGLILCVGPTGSGKTTTLHSVLGYINKPERKIWTAEDPVEITQYGLRQVQVQPKIGFTFAAAMRSFLRADPDVIMVGEMRDEETASTGIEASLTGHLVFSTLHTNSSVETVIRLLDMGLDPFNFADALLCVLAQRLVKRICVECKEEYHPEQEEYDQLVRAYGAEHWEKLGIKYDDDFILYRGKGCGTCSTSGYRGRAGIHELLVATDSMKRLIQTKARVAEMLVVAREDGMTTLVQDGILKSLDGVTDFQQVKAVAIK